MAINAQCRLPRSTTRKWRGKVCQKILPNCCRNWHWLYPLREITSPKGQPSLPRRMKRSYPKSLTWRRRSMTNWKQSITMTTPKSGVCRCRKQCKVSWPPIKRSIRSLSVKIGKNVKRSLKEWTLSPSAYRQRERKERKNGKNSSPTLATPL